MKRNIMCCCESTLATCSKSHMCTHGRMLAHLVVHLLGAVKHVDHDAQGSAQVLGRFCLPCACGARRRSAHGQVEGLGQGDVASEKQARCMCASLVRHQAASTFFCSFTLKGLISHTGALLAVFLLHCIYGNWLAQEISMPAHTQVRKCSLWHSQKKKTYILYIC